MLPEIEVKRSLSAGQYLFLVVITLCYLVLELGFNARLLDVVGGGAGSKDVEHIEIYGRLLSGVAVALFVFQLLLKRRASLSSTKPSYFKILIICAATILLVFFSIKTFVDHVVLQKSAEFRKLSVNMVLLQESLVTGRAKLDHRTFDADPVIFLKPEGKAFLALFPFMAASIDSVDERIKTAKLNIIADIVSDNIGGPAALYKNNFVPAIDNVRAQWNKYQKIPIVTNSDSEVESQQNKAWDRYVNSLHKRGWEPTTVPSHAVRRVRNDVRREVAVPADWDPADEYSFREAVARSVEKKLSAVKTDGSVTVEGQRIPPGLNFENFLDHPAIQKSLRNKFELPSNVKVEKDFGGSAERFKHNFYDPYITNIATKKLKDYDAPVSKYENGEELADRGAEAARAVMVPPIALGFSMLGAFGHLSKLTFLFTSLVLLLLNPHRVWLKHGVPWLAMGAIGLCVVLWLDSQNNRVTESKLYAFMLSEVTKEDRLQNQSNVDHYIAKATHRIVVGQGATYPLNEWIRINILQGFKYGYESSLSN